MKNKVIHVLDVEERLDSENILQFKEESKSYLNSKGVGLIINFSNTKFIDSMGLGSLVSILKSTSKGTITVALSSLSPQVKQIFELTRLYRLFNVFDNVEDAKTFINSNAI